MDTISELIKGLDKTMNYLDKQIIIDTNGFLILFLADIIFLEINSSSIRIFVTPKYCTK